MVDRPEGRYGGSRWRVWENLASCSRSHHVAMLSGLYLVTMPVKNENICQAQGCKQVRLFIVETPVWGSDYPSVTWLLHTDTPVYPHHQPRSPKADHHPVHLPTSPAVCLAP